MIRFKCPHCGKTSTAKDEGAGKTGKCPGCGRAVRVPKAEPSPAPSSERVVTVVEEPVDVQVRDTLPPARGFHAFTPARRTRPVEAPTHRETVWKAWEPCPRCGSNKVESRGGCFWFLTGFSLTGCSIWLLIIPPIGILGILLGLFLMCIAPFAFNMLQCKDCNHAWRYSSQKRV